MRSLRWPRYAVIVLSLIVAALVAAALGIFVARSVAAGLDRHRAIAVNLHRPSWTAWASRHVPLRR